MPDGVIIGGIIVVFGWIAAIVGGIFLIQKKIDQRVDEKINLSPMVQKVPLIEQKLEIVKKDVCEIKNVVRRIEINLAKAGINGSKK